MVRLRLLLSFVVRRGRGERRYRHDAPDRPIQPVGTFFPGTAGAVDPGLRAGDVVIGATVAQHDVGLQTTNGS